MSSGVSCIGTDHTAAMAIPGIPTTVLVAPDSFKGTMTAAEVADAIGRGLEAAGRPVDLCPVADGGEGTLEALLRALDGERRTVAATGPLGHPLEASFGIGEGRRGQVLGVVETAAASGLGLVDPTERDPIAASTFGTGQLIMAAIEAGAELVYLGVGGSATTDGGAGAIRAIREGGGLGDSTDRRAVRRADAVRARRPGVRPAEGRGRARRSSG